jgi:hypothetical protein
MRARRGAEARVPEDFGHRDAEVFFVEGVGEEGVATKGERTIKAAVDGDDRRSAAGHCLNGGHAEGFVAAAEDKHIGRAVGVGQVGIGDERAEADAIGVAGACGEGAEFGEQTLLEGIHFLAADGEVENGGGVALGDEREGGDEEIVAFVAGEAAEGEDDAAFEAEALADGVATGVADGEEAVVVVAGRDHANFFGGRAVVLHDEIELRRRGGDDELGGGVDLAFGGDAAGEIVLLFELRLVARVVALHLALFPEAERVGGVDMGDAERLSEVLAGESGVPVVAVDKAVGEAVRGDEAEGVGIPLGEMFVQVFLGEKIAATAGYGDDADAVVDGFELGLVFETAGPDVDLVAELGEFFGEFDHIDDLTTGIGGAERRLGGDVAMDRNHGDARKRTVESEK